MLVISTIILLLIVIMILVSVKEPVYGEYRKEPVLIPFYKAVSKAQKVNLIKRLSDRWIAFTAQSYKPLHLGKDVNGLAKYKCRRIMAEGLLIITAAAFLVVLISLTDGNNTIESLKRGQPGEGEIVYELQAEIDGESRNIPVSISEKEYTKEEVEELFAYGNEHIEEMILGKNESLDEVTENLNLISKLPDSDITVNWESDNYSLVQPNGELVTENLSAEGTCVILTAIFTYEDYEQQKEIAVIVKKASYKGIDGKFADLEEHLRQNETLNRSDEEYVLPDEIMGEKVAFSEGENITGFVILFLAAVIAFLLPFEEKAIISKKNEERINQMILAYPELVYKLSLYMGAGMSVSKAWERIAISYVETKKAHGKTEYCNEEILYTYRQLQSGILKRKAFEEFGNRCKVQLYKKLSLLINSNIKKGSSDLSDILLNESQEALLNRKGNVVKMANEASAKLMLPMLLELVVVIGVLIIPAFMSMKF